MQRWYARSSSSTVIKITTLLIILYIIFALLSNCVFIDAKLGRQEQQKVFLHEIGHVNRNDFDRSNVQHIESLAHNINL